MTVSERTGAAAPGLRRRAGVAGCVAPGDEGSGSPGEAPRAGAFAGGASGAGETASGEKL